MTNKQPTAFERALTDAALNRYQKILDEDPSPIQLSDAFQASIDKLTHKSSRKTWKYVNRAWKRVLIAAILMFLLAATAVAAVPALREGLIRFFIHDDGVKYSFEFTSEDISRAPKEINTYYAPRFLPAGFSLETENVLSDYFDQLYFDQDGNAFYYSQSVLWAYEDLAQGADITVHLGISSEDCEREIRVINGFEVYVLHIFSPNGQNGLVAFWTDHEYFYEINYPSYDLTTLEDIIVSMDTVQN